MADLDPADPDRPVPEPVPRDPADLAPADPHVLYVAWGFPPCRGGGVYRTLASANAFARGGFRVTVLTATRGSFARYTGTDESLEHQVDGRIRVVRVPFDWPARETDVRSWTPLRAAAPRVWWRLRKWADLRSFPEYGYGPWRPALEAAALEVHRSDPVDLVVASANPHVDFTAADVLHRRYGIRYVMDYRDAWMLDVFGGGLTHPEGGRVDRLERRLLESAHEVWFVNEPIRSWHAQRHPDLAHAMHVVANGYDPQLAPTARLSPPDPDRPLVFGYLGTASPKVPVQQFAQGWRLARQQAAQLRDARAELWGYLGFYADPDAGMQALLDQYAADGLSYRGPVAKTAVAARYATFDAVLLILGTGQYVTSGKVYEYLATAMPVVSVHDPGNAASTVLRDYPLWFPARSLQPEHIAQALTAAAQAARTADETTRRQCARYAEGFRREVQLNPRVEALRVAVSSPGQPAQTRPEQARPERPRPTQSPVLPRSPDIPDSPSGRPERAPADRHPETRVVVLSIGVPPGAGGEAAHREARERLGLTPADRLVLLSRRSRLLLPALIATLGTRRARRLLRGADLVVAADRTAASLAWVVATTLSTSADIVHGWEAGAAVVRRRREPGSPAPSG